MKLVAALGGGGVLGAFPEAECLGLIEAASRVMTPRSWPSFPEAECLGLIEADPVVTLPPTPPVFPEAECLGLIEARRVLGR